MKKEIIFGAVFALMLGACSTNDAPEPVVSDPENPIVENPIEDDIVLPPANLKSISGKYFERNTDFALNMLKEGLKINKDKNIVLSPIGALTTLSMAINGEGDRNYYLRALGFEESAEGLKELNEYNYILNTALCKLDPENVIVKMSNSFWNEEQFRIIPKLKYTLEKYYSLFDGGGIPWNIDGFKKINSFIDDQTNGLIPKFIDSDPGDRFILINTLYLNAQWTTKFDERETIKDKFYNLDGTEGAVNMMNIEAVYPYSKVNGICSVTLPYGEGDFSMTVIYPNEEGADAFDAMKNQLNIKTLQALLDSQDEMNMKLSLPNFECSSSPGLIKILKSMNAFNPDDPFGLVQYNNGKNYTNYFTESWTIQQQAVIKVNENGTEGAAVTAIAGSDSALNFHVKINRPFIYLVREESTGIVLFAGAMTKF